MDDKKFNELSNNLFMQLEDLLDDLDIDVQVNDNVLVAGHNNEQIYINKHLPMKQIWLSAQNIAYHFNFDGANWVDTKDNQEIFALLSQVLTAILGYVVRLQH